MEEETDAFAERYAPRSGIESTNSGLKNRLDLGRLSVRGLKGVSRVVLHKLAGWNVSRASASQKLKSWVASRVAETLGRGVVEDPEAFFIVGDALWADQSAFSAASCRRTNVPNTRRRLERIQEHRTS